MRLSASGSGLDRQSVLDFVCTQTGEAAVVDGPQADEVLTYVEQRGIRLTTILNTHTHGDHIGLNLDLQRRGRLDEYRVVGLVSTAGTRARTYRTGVGE